MCDLTGLLAAIDEDNSADPNRFQDRPRAQVQGELASDWLAKLDAGASEELQVTARAHHLRRWEVARTDFPPGRAGYLKWRRSNKDHQVGALTTLMGTNNWPAASVARARSLLTRTNLGTDGETQTLEDAACLVFLQTQINDLSDRLDRGHLVSVVTKTLKKMSDIAIAQAATIDLNHDTRQVLTEAVGLLNTQSQVQQPSPPAPTGQRATCSSANISVDRPATKLQVAADVEVTARTAILWAIERFGSELTLLCSGQDAVLVDLALSVDPTIEVTFIDTGYHFSETLRTIEKIGVRYGVQARVIAPLRDLPGSDEAGFCCADFKVEQLATALEGRKAWLSGLRRADGPSRARTPQVERDRRGLTKINPIVAWTHDHVDRYIRERHVIVNPLRAAGYASIGCEPCTMPCASGSESRAGRWAGSEKTECGLHL